MGQFSASQNAVAALGDGLDWSAAAARDLEALRTHYAKDQQATAALIRALMPF